MRARAYELSDMQVVERYFGPDPKQRAILDIARDHGELVWEGDLGWTPGGGAEDTITLGTEPTEEFVVLARTVVADEDLLVLLVGRAGQTVQTIYEA